MLFIVVIVLQYSQNIPLKSELFWGGGVGTFVQGEGLGWGGVGRPRDVISVDSCKTHP